MNRNNIARSLEKTRGDVQTRLTGTGSEEALNQCVFLMPDAISERCPSPDLVSSYKPNSQEKGNGLGVEW
jgi:hypothetical protein